MSLTAEDIRNCTMIALDQPPWWPEEIDNVFKFTIYITNPNTNCRIDEILPVNATCIVDWDDGTIDEISNPQPRHTYRNTGTYQIKITYPHDTTPMEFRTWGQCFFIPAKCVISVDTKFPKVFSIASGFARLTYSLFRGCSSLLTIPNGLFDYIPPVSLYDFSYCFYGCSSLQEIPSGLFGHCTEAKEFSYCFYGCSSLQEIPSGLFDYCTNVLWFTECFCRCGRLREIPSEIFTYNTNIINVTGCFRECRQVTSAVPELWITHPSITEHDECFYLCTRALNYNSIPSSWK